MNSIITNKNYNKQILYNKYDNIIAICVSKMLENAKIEATASKKEFTLYLGEIKKDDLNSEFMFKIAKFCNTFKSCPIYIETNFLNYRRIKKENKTYVIKRLRKNKKVFKNYARDFLEMIKNSSYKDIYTDKIFEEIYNTFWIKKESEEN